MKFSLTSKTKNQKSPPITSAFGNLSTKPDEEIKRRHFVVSMEVSGNFEASDGTVLDPHANPKFEKDFVIPCKHLLNDPKEIAKPAAKPDPTEVRKKYRHIIVKDERVEKEDSNELKKEEDLNLKKEEGVATEDKEAVNAILHDLESRDSGVTFEERVESSSAKISVPILARNTDLLKIRSDTDSNDVKKFHDEISLCPEVRLSQYDSVPVEEFGVALLKGMGFNPQKHATKPYVFTARQYIHGGLGSDQKLKEEKEKHEKEKHEKSKVKKK
eukprot:GHVP01035824.1.p3 GENE.GHVP01035824.1~~GHVP01035824.1.p3  ORF type:complete len:272 (+),score=80.23 GHVP01035824.1:2444-3259(+)